MNNVNLVEGNVVAKEDLKVGIVASRFNEIITNKLLGGAIDGLVRHGVEDHNITTAWVPGAFEIPIVAKRFAEAKRFNAVIALGCVIQGATSHANYVNEEVSKGLAQISLETGVPNIYAVVTAENIEQAIERSGCKAGNRGASAAETAIEMASLLQNIPQGK